MSDVRSSFAFLVVTYNHQDYILEHLESIKYLVLTHGVGMDVDLIVNDDCSRDQTQTLVDAWLALNPQLFRHVKTIYNPKNLGTCASVNNMLTHMVADRCKLTAGDDVYSFENIFELTKCDSDVAIVSGRALYLLDDLLDVDRLSDNLATATQVIYKNKNLLYRFKHFSYNNAPNLLYATECLLHPSVREFLEQFDVTEDWPLQVAIARQFPKRRFSLINEVLVYYRRTAGSTYIVANKRFTRDKIKIYGDLICKETSWVEKIRLANRRFCFKSQSRWVNKLFNFDFYFFALSYVSQMFGIALYKNNIKKHLYQHRQHYTGIKALASAVRSQFN